ncbi:MAG TPA: response regulator [Catenuloplanes sp.]|jgi:CheY-like chemotaxis protein
MIVFAEDHDDIRYAVTRALQRAGHEVIAAPDGASAWEAVRRHRPDIVITDVDMPGMTGLQLCRAIRDDDTLRHIPVVLASGSLLPGDRRAVEAGASETLLKPFVPAQLLDCLARLLPPPGRPGVGASTVSPAGTGSVPAAAGSVAAGSSAATSSAATSPAATSPAAGTATVGSATVGSATAGSAGFGA